MKTISRILTGLLIFYLAVGIFLFVMSNGDNAANWIFVYALWASPTLPWIERLPFVHNSPLAWWVFYPLALLTNGLVPYLIAHGLLRRARKANAPSPRK